jgi:sugar lactone lactonase YvrE
MRRAPWGEKMKPLVSFYRLVLPMFIFGAATAALLLLGCGNPYAGDLLDAGPPDAALIVIDAGPPDADPPDAQPLTIGLSTLAGGPDPGFDDGARNVATFNDPVNVAVAPDNVVFVADFNNGALRRVTEDGHVTTFTHQPGFNRPFGIAFSPDGDLYVETDRNTLNQATGALWKVNSSTGAATLLVDNVGKVRGLDVLSDGRVVLSDYQAHIVRLYDPISGQLSDLAGQANTPGFVDAKGALARFNIPYDIVVGKNDAIFVSDFANHRIRKVALDGTVTTYAGNATSGTVNGTLAQARFINPQGLAIDAAGVLYVSDPAGHVIRRINPVASATQVATVAGDGTAGYIDDLDPLTARFYGLEGIDITNDGVHLYIADGDLGEGGPYHRLRRVAF